MKIVVVIDYFRWCGHAQNIGTKTMKYQKLNINRFHETILTYCQPGTLANTAACGQGQGNPEDYCLFAEMKSKYYKAASILVFGRL